MAIRAGISAGYRRKLAIMGVFLLAFGLWAAYDALVKYPAQYERYTVWRTYQAEGDPAGWVEHAQNVGWSTDEPPRRTHGNFYFNYALMALIPIGGWLLYSSATAGRRWIEADDQGIRTHRGQQLTYDQIESINEKRWQTKGIAIVTYKDEAGRRQKLVLDDFNYQTQPIRDIFGRAKAVLNPAPPPEVQSSEASSSSSSSAGESMAGQDQGSGPTQS